MRLSLPSAVLRNMQGGSMLQSERIARGLSDEYKNGWATYIGADVPGLVG